jgi:3'(2'),5'-bisphosphate nucleotidase
VVFAAIGAANHAIGLIYDRNGFAGAPRLRNEQLYAEDGFSMNADEGARPVDLASETSDAIARFLASVALAAGPAVMEEYRGGAAARAKKDGSPVTAADERAEAIIRDRLSRLATPIPIVAEEATAAGQAIEIAERFILVDPLDGTREFVARNGEFTINVALVARGVPIAGAVYAPALERLWFGGRTAHACRAPVGAELPDAASWRILHARPAPEALVALASRSHGDPATEAFLERLPVGERRSAGSSLKFCVIAEGEGDVYPRFAPTMEWDTAAGDAVLRAAGGVVLAVEGGPLVYGKVAAGLRNGGFVAWGDPSLAARVADR